MPTLARLGVELDSSQAKQGGGEIKQVLRDIGSEAEGAQGKAAALGQTLSDASKQAARDVGDSTRAVNEHARSLEAARQIVENLQRSYANQARVAAGGGGLPPSGGGGPPVIPPSNINANASALRDLQHAQAGVSTGFSSMADNADRNANSLMRLLRAIAPFGTEATEMAERAERVSLLFDVMGERANRAATSQEVLTNAYRQGAIALPNMESAQQRLNVARQQAEQAEQRYQTVLRVSQNTTSNAEQMARLLIQRRTEMVAANRELAESERIVEAANAANSKGWGTTIAVVSGLVVGLVGLTIVVEGVRKAWEFLTEALREGAQTERTETQFAQLIGDSKAAAGAFEELRQFALNSGDLFKPQDLTKVAGTLYSLGEAFQDVVPLTKAFAEAAAATEQPIGLVQESYSRLVSQITYGEPIMARELSTFDQTIRITKILSDSMGITADRARALLTSGNVSVAQLKQAFLDASNGSGVFANAVERQAGNALGIVAQIQRRWGEVKSAFGEPLVIALEPILQRIIPYEDTAEGKARELGEAVAEFIRQLDQIAQRDPWAAFKLGFTIMAKELANTLSDLLQQAIDKVSTYASNKTAEIAIKTASGYYAASAAVQLGKAGITQLLEQAGYPVGGNAGNTPGQRSPLFPTDADWAEFRALVGKTTADGIGDAFKDTQVGNAIAGVFQQWGIPQKGVTPIPYRSDANIYVGGGYNGTIPPLNTPPRTTPDRPAQPPPQGTDARQVYDDWKKVETTLESVNDRLERQRVINDAIASTVKNLKAPVQQIADLERKMADAGASQADIQLMKWRAYYAERQRLEAETDDRMRAGMASVTESISAGLNKLVDQLGTWQTRLANAIVDIGNALTNDISSGLADIINGTKGVAQGFRDMAVSVLQDIEKIILKLEIEYLVTQLLKAAGYGGASSAGTGLAQYGIAAATAAAGGGHATGGAIIGGKGGIDDIPAWLTSGEYVLTQRDVTRMGGADAIDQWRQGYGKGGRATHRVDGIPPAMIAGAEPTLPGAESVASGRPHIIYEDAPLVRIPGGRMSQSQIDQALAALDNERLANAGFVDLPPIGGGGPATGDYSNTIPTGLPTNTYVDANGNPLAAGYATPYTPFTDFTDAWVGNPNPATEGDRAPYVDTYSYFNPQPTEAFSPFDTYDTRPTNVPVGAETFPLIDTFDRGTPNVPTGDEMPPIFDTYTATPPINIPTGDETLPPIDTYREADPDFSPYVPLTDFNDTGTGLPFAGATASNVTVDNTPAVPPASSGGHVPSATPSLGGEPIYQANQVNNFPVVTMPYGSGDVWGAGGTPTDIYGNVRPGTGRNFGDTVWATNPSDPSSDIPTPPSNPMRDRLLAAGMMHGDLRFFGGGLVPSLAEIASWPRYHAGLLPDERAAVIKKDEAVLTPSDLRAMKGGGSGAVQQTNSFQFELHMHSDGRVEANQTSSGSAQSAETGRALLNRVREVIADETRSGGIIERWGRASQVKNR